MKKTLFQWLIILLVAGGVWYFVSERNEVTNGTKEAEGTSEEVAEEEDHKEVVPGTYVIYETSVGGTYSPEKNTLYRLRPFEDESPVAFATIVADDRWSGSVWSEIVGQEVFVHRFTPEENGLIALDGTTVSFDTSGGARIASADGEVWVDYALEFENRAATLSFNVQSSRQLDNNVPLVTKEIDPAELGITLGYAEPFLVSDDGEHVYLRQVFEGEGCNINGLWRLDVTTGEIETLTVLKDLDIVDYSINPTTEQLIGVGYKLIDDPEAIGPNCGKADGTRTVYLVDLKTGEQQVLTQDDELVYYRPMLSDDGSQYAMQVSGSESVWIGTTGSGEVPAQAPTEALLGYLEDWVEGWLVVDYGNELQLYDLETGETQILGNDEGPYDAADYVGTITIE